MQGLQYSVTSTGNGLRIVQRCMRLLGGSLTLRFLTDSVVAALTFPLTQIDVSAPALPATLRVASVDDDEVMRRVDRVLFAELGIEAVSQGASATEIEAFPIFVAAMVPPPQVRGGGAECGRG